MMKKVSLPSLLLVFALLASLLAGCAGTAAKKESSAPAETASPDSAEAWIGSLEDLAGKKVGILTGSINEQDLVEQLPTAEITYFNSIADMATALDARKIDAFVDDESTQRFILQQYPSFSALTQLSDFNYACFFPKTETGQQLCEQMNEFLSGLRADGTLEAIDALWFGEDESAKTLDYPTLTAENGTLKMGVSSSIGYPFVYLQDNTYIGYELDIALRFCQAYGYGLTVEDYTFDGLLAAVSSGKCDFGGSGVTVTEERKESVYFSDPTYYSGSVVTVRTEDLTEEAIPAATASEETSMAVQFAGQRIGVVTGSVYDQYVNEQLPDSQVEYFNAVSDMALALDTGRIAAYVLDKPSASLLFHEYTNQGIYTELTESSYAFIFPKDNEKSDRIREQMNEYLAKIKEDGTAALLEEIWFGSDESLKVVNYDGLTGENGTLNFAVCTDVGVPFSYVKNGDYAGYDLDMAVRFCREYGYDIHVVDSYLSGFLASVTTGKCDFGGASVAITPERQEAMNFSDPNYTGGVLLIANKEDIPEADAAAEEQTAFEPLRGKTVGVISGSVYEDYVNRYIPEGQTEYFDSVQGLASSLDSGAISAYILEEPAAKLMFLEYEDQGIYTVLSESNYAFFFPKGNEEGALLRAQMNEYLATIQADGTAALLEDIWFGSDENLKVVDMDGLTGENGTLDFAICTDVGVPFAYVKDEQYVGYDVDMAVRFCREYGYGINIVDSYFSGFLASVVTGKCDFGASSVAVTAEREDILSFSDPNYTANIVLVANKEDIPPEGIHLGEQAGYEALRGKKIGVVTGMLSDVIAKEKIPDCQVEYFSGNADLALALDTGKVDAYIADEPVFRLLQNEYPDIRIYETIFENGYGYIFQKDQEDSDLLRAQMNEFLQTLRDDGTMQELDDIWFGQDESRKVVDYSGLTGKNGTLSFATTSSTGAPFCYVQDGQYVGYDIDIVVRFCRDYGYDLKIVDSDFNGMLANVTSGKCDLGGSCITITEERKESVNFSDPNYEGGLVLVVRDSEDGGTSGTALTVSDPSVYEELRGCKIGVLTGTIFDAVAAETVPDCERVLYNSNSDLALALDTDKVDAYMCDEPTARMLMNEYDDQNIFALVKLDSYAFIFQKDNERSDTLRTQMNEFLQKLRDDGTLEEIKALWIGKDTEHQVVDYSGLTGENGTIRYASSSAMGAPFCYLKDDQYAGYEVDILVRFCREYGYTFELSDSDFNGILTNVTSGKCDLGGGGISVTEERKETMNFSDPCYEGGYVLVTKSDNSAEDTSESGFLSSVKDSFTKTFLRENRWQLFLSGMGVTLLITVLSALFGTVIAFLLFLLYRKNYAVAKITVDVLTDILQKTPVVVILMILYYIIFGQLSLDSMWVSCLGFTFIFAGSVIGLLKVAVGAIDDGQMEAALALGYTDTRAFLRIILPQALQHFLPGYKSEIVALIKGTAVVGYIAVQDLTKISDIVRSRTYEAFFPLIATAVIYYALAWLLTLLVRRIQFRVNPKHRSKETVLKGVQTK